MIITNWPNRFPKFAWVCLVVLATLAIGLILYPGFTHPERLMPDDNDSLLEAYIIRQTQINWTSPGKGRWWGSFFAPYPDTLRYSEPFATSAILTLPLVVAGQTNPLVIFNFALLLALVLTSVSCFFLFDYLFGQPALATVATLLLNFSGFHWHYLPHLQEFGFWLLAASVYFFLRWQEDRQLTSLALLLAALSLQAAESFFYLYLAALAFRPRL